MIKIKHNIKRKGCTLSGQILDCQFSGEHKRSQGAGDGGCYERRAKFMISSASYPALYRGALGDVLFIWGWDKQKDLQDISYTYPTEQAAQDMLDFINTFVGKEGTVQSEPKEKRYMLIEVGGRCCQALTNDNICVLDGDCDNCPHGKTLEQIQEEVKKLQEAQ